MTQPNSADIAAHLQGLAAGTLIDRMGIEITEASADRIVAGAGLARRLLTTCRIGHSVDLAMNKADKDLIWLHGPLQPHRSPRKPASKRVCS